MCAKPPRKISFRSIRIYSVQKSRIPSEIAYIHHPGERKKVGSHCWTRISWLVVHGGTINSQIVKQEGEYTPRVPDTVTHVPLRTRTGVPSSKFYRGTNPTKTIIKLCTLQPSRLREASVEGFEARAHNQTGKKVAVGAGPSAPFQRVLKLGKLVCSRLYFNYHEIPRRNKVPLISQKCRAVNLIIKI